MLAGDVELNPGPQSADISSSTESFNDYMNVSVFEKNFSLVHYNVQSLLNKTDQIQMELCHFDIIALSETWLSPTTEDNDIKLINCQHPFRKDRQTNNYDGVIVYFRDNIPCKRRQDLEFQGLEWIWLELKLKSKTILFDIFYRPPNSSNEILETIDDSVGLALDNDFIITGDLNLSFLEVATNYYQSLISTPSVRLLTNPRTSQKCFHL